MSAFTALDAQFMARALQLARKGLYTTDPNPRVGCVLARHDRIIGEGYHVRRGEGHAETLALAQCVDAKGATAYVTLEPCCHHGSTPPCADALIAAGVRRVVAAMQDPNPLVAGKGFARLAAAGIQVDTGLMEAEARALNPGFIARMARQRPYVRVKLAATLDGRTALADGRSKWITSESAREDVQRWRARSSAVLTGIGTVLADDPSLNVRAFDIGRQPLRVVVDSRWRTPASAKLFRHAGAVLVVGASAAGGEALRTAGADVLALPDGDGRVDLTALMRALAERQVNELWVEAGATLAGALFQARQIDEFVLYYASSFFGGDARALVALPPLSDTKDCARLTVTDVRAIGPDWRVIARPEY